MAGAVPDPFLQFNYSQLQFQTKRPESAHALPLCFGILVLLPHVTNSGVKWCFPPAFCARFWFGLNADVYGAAGVSCPSPGWFLTLSWFELFEHANSRLYFNVKSEMKLQCPSTSTFATTSLSKLTLRCISDNLVQREPLERNENNIRKGLETVTKETPALHFCFQGWVEWHVQNCSTFCHVTNILGFVMMQYRQLSQQGIDCNARLGENCFSFYLGRSGHCLTTFLEASGEFFGFLRAVC